MDDVRRRDIKLFVQELFRFGALATTIFLTVVLSMIVFNLGTASLSRNLIGLTLLLSPAAVHVYRAHQRAVSRRFLSPRFRELWNGCKSRTLSFHSAVKQLKKADIARFEEMPGTIQEVCDNLYRALRKADLLTAEVLDSESVMMGRQPMLAPMIPTADPQANELYRIADKNMAEYRNLREALASGVHRVEGQAAVFITTIDALRVKMLGYRFVDKNPDLNSGDFLSSLAEARLQLNAIDQALDELDLTHYPKTISVIDHGRKPGGASGAEVSADQQSSANLTPPPIPPGAATGQSLSDRLQQAERAPHLPSDELPRQENA